MNKHLFWAIFWLALAAVLASRLVSREKEDRAQLVQALEQERFANMQIQMVPYEQKTGPVDYGAVGETEYLTQTPAALVAAMRRMEQGRKFRELGFHGKTQFAVEFFELKDRQYGEAGREATRVLWRWVQEDPERWREFTDALGRSYHGGSRESDRSWSKQVRSLAKQERAGHFTGQEGTKKTKR